jgi:hypothetical protein
LAFSVFSAGAFASGAGTGAAGFAAGFDAISSCVEQAESANRNETAATPPSARKPFIKPPH